jgi:Domain of unknown function (DUF4270)
VKKELAAKCKFGFAFALMVITFLSCTNDSSKTGLGLLPTGDLVVVGKVTDSKIQAFVVNDEKQRTDKPRFNLLGTFNDPVFGKTTADFANQYRLTGYPGFNKTNHIDSLVLYTAYKQVYGDITTPQILKVYELSSDLPFDDKFYQDIDLKGMSKSEVLAEKSYIPKFKLFYDSLKTVKTTGSTKLTPKDTVSQEISFKLSSTLINKLLAADSVTNSKNDLFLQYFKGLYIEAGNLNSGGTLMKTVGSGLMMYYHIANDTIQHSYVYTNNKTASSVSRFTHDYSQTAFFPHLNKETVQDSLIYLQTSGGLRVKVLIPNLGIWSKIIPAMSNNPDTTRLAINKAELIFTLDTIQSEPLKYLPSEQLVFSAIASDGKTYLPTDYFFSPAYFGGGYNILDHTYRFNITQHIKDVITKKKTNYGFYLETSFKNSIARRLVLKGATSKTGIKLEITYSKIQ